VDSYIPELFKDLEWRIDGGVRLNGNDSDMGNQENHSDAQSINLGNYISYRYETIPVSLVLGSSLDIFLSNSVQTYFSSFSSVTEQTDMRDEERENDCHEVRASPFLYTRFYMFEDIFVGLDCNLDWQYRKGPGGDNLLESYSKEYFPGDYIREKWYERDLEEYRDLKHYNLDASFMPGWGRAYDGIFAANAIFLIDELKGNGALLKNPDYDQMIELTEIIYQNQQQHSIDKRISDIEAVRAIADYLETEGIIVSDIAGYNVITDIWKYYPEISRRFGFLLSAGAGINHIYSSDQYSRTGRQITITHKYHKDSIEYKQITVDTNYVNHNSGYHQSGTLVYLMASGEYFRPINHRWQLDFLSRIKHIFESYGTEPYDYDNINDFYDFYNMATIGYILNTRTNLSLSGILNYANFKRNSKNDPDYYSYGKWYYALNLEATYRISIPTRLKVTVEVKSGHPTMDVLQYGTDHDESSYLISASISHYLY
jgi:hypothetical protein